jgi:flagellar hook-associated protein 1 FlgK
MSGIMNVGVGALVSNQIALQTIGNNIANVNTPGYSRQAAVLKTVQGQATGGGFIGKGVDVQTIVRSYDDFLTKQSALANSNASEDKARYDFLQRTQEIFQTGENGLGATIGNFFNSFADVSLAPSDTTSRSVVMTRADQMAQQFNSNAASLGDLKSGVVDQLKNDVSTVNNLITQIASTNYQIAQAMSGGQVPNDLLDQRDQLIHQVNKYIQTSQVAGDNGQISLFICNSMPVVLGSKPATLSVGYDSFNNTNKSKLSYSLGGTSTTELNEDFMGGGEITGLLKFQNKDLVDATNLLGRMALAIGTVLNNQQALGVDPNGNAGSNLYNIASIPNALSKSSNTGTASIAVTVQSSPSGATSFKASDYQLDYNGATWTATRTLDGVTTNLSAAPYNFPTAPANLDGLTFTLSSGTAASGDSFFARPFATTASNISTAFATTQGLAMASPVAASAGVSNKGTLTLQSLSALSALGTIPVTPVTLTFTNTGSSYTYTRSDGLPFVPNNTYTPGTAISYNAGGTGWSVTLKGIPQTGDTVIIGRNSNFSLDAGNAQALLDLRDLNLFDGLRPLTDGYASLVAAVGVKVQSAQSAQQISTDISASLDKQKTSISGVNLDEEAARMLQYQQAYQAAGKMMQIAQSIFQTLLQGLG